MSALSLTHGVLLRAGCMLGLALALLSPDVRAKESILGTPAEVSIAWPAPPDVERVRYIREIAGNANLATQSKLLEALTGNHKTGFARPYAVCGNMDEMLCVVDADLPALLIYDLRAGRVYTSKKQHGLQSPVGVCSNGKDVIYVSDSETGRILMFDVKGELIGPLSVSPELGRPTGLCYDPKRDRLWVADAKERRVIAYDSNGKRLKVLGRQDELTCPRAVAVGADERVYVVDTLGCCVCVFDAEKQTLLSKIGGEGMSAGQFTRPSSIALDASGNIYVSDAAFNNVQIFSPDGHLLLFIGGGGTAPGMFDIPAGLWIDNKDRLYACDSLNQRIQVFALSTGTAKEGVQQ